MVDDYGDPPIRTELCEPWLFLDVLANVDPLPCIGLAVGGFELFEEDGDFVAVGGAPGQD